LVEDFFGVDVVTIATIGQNEIEEDNCSEMHKRGRERELERDSDWSRLKVR